MIQSVLDHELIEEKTRDLCRTILEQPAFATLRRDVERFLGDESAQKQYEEVSERGRGLHLKQTSGAELGMEEIESFEKLRRALLENPTATAFLEAQQAMNEIQERVNRWISKSFELGRLPGDDELDCDNEGGCGSGCGCK